MQHAEGPDFSNRHWQPLLGTAESRYHCYAKVSGVAMALLQNVVAALIHLATCYTSIMLLHNWCARSGGVAAAAAVAASIWRRLVHSARDV